MPVDAEQVDELVESGLEIRSYTPDLEVRSTKRGREVTGIAVPWDVETEIDEYLIEGFRRGAMDHQFPAAHRVAFSREHIKLGGSLIGRGLEMRNDAAGLWVKLLASRTPLGEETAQLLDDKALRQLSVAFEPRRRVVTRSAAQVRNRAGQLVDSRGRSTVWRTRVDLREVAVVMEGAYGDLAAALAVRHKKQEEEPRPGLVEAQQTLDKWRPLPVPPAPPYA